MPIYVGNFHGVLRKCDEDTCAHMMLSSTLIAETLVVCNLHVYVSYTLKRYSLSFSLSLSVGVIGK
jgi:hypothetical protein